jgi:pimeloyl-ACP methyl ester carboxylesterase
MSDWKKTSRRMLIVFMLTYIVLCICSCAFQRSLLYFPTQFPVALAEIMATKEGMLPWKNSAGQIIGWKIPANEISTGSILIVHGNAGCALNRDYLARPIHDAANVDVFILEYPGYGSRGGSPSKKSFDAAADEAFHLLPKTRPKYIVSESIGTGVACDLAKKYPTEISGLALIAPYHDLATVAQRHMWFLPAYFFLLDRFNPAEDLKSYHGPVKFVIAGDDEIIGPASGTRLSEEYNGPKDLQIIVGAHHNDIAEQSSDWWKEVFLFWQTKN